MNTFETRCLHSLVKVFADEELREEDYVHGSALRGEYYSFQVAYRSKELLKNVRVSVESGFGEALTVRSVGLVPSELPNYADHDDYLLRTTPGLYPDPLYPVPGGKLHALPGQWHAVWVTVHVAESIQPGTHPIEIRFVTDAGEPLGAETFRLEVIKARLPEQKHIHTEWFYLDCLATWYDVKAFSEAHWVIIEKFLDNYVEHGMNMILTPLFTPPLETEVGNERPTVQLIGVKREGTSYSFDFSLLERWIELCVRKGIRYFEFSHLFTQWGAKHVPKIIAEVDGVKQRIFGWETDAAGEAYRDFLKQFVPELVRVVREHGLEDRCYIHLSDEPYGADIPSYTQASELVRSLCDFPVIDALSDYYFYETGLVTHPVVSTEHIGKFLDNKANPLWAYYCCCEYKDQLSNRFFNMPSSRTRVIGAQLYKYDIEGFLHWGYNHWYSQKSLRKINPYQVTDADHGFPSGDAFLVYPGEDGPIGSIRLAVMREAMQDIRALQLLEAFVGKEKALACVEQGLTEPLTFNHYPRRDQWMIEMRERVNQMIKACVQGERSC